MRYTVNQIRSGYYVLILNYNQINAEVEAVLAFMEKHQKQRVGKSEGETIIFSPQEIVYIEKVAEKTFACTMDKVIQLDVSLATAELILDDESYFRCSKSMIVNVNKVEKLKSMPSNRIDATLVSGEHIIISRTYASDFRRLLKGERA